MTSKEIRPLDVEGLEKALGERYKEMFRLRFKATTEKVESVAQIRKLRRTIARIKTIQRQRELGIAK